MRDIRIAAAQFENRNDNKSYNLSVIRRLTERAVDAGAEFVSFHEGAISAYSFIRRLGRPELTDVAEPVPDGPSVRKLMGISRDHHVPIGAGLIERDGNRLFNTYVVVDGDNLVARHRKLHSFINKHLSPGSE